MPANKADPLGNFLFARKKCHWEFFESAMAIMLRTLGIPTRVVNGFRGGELNDITGRYIVRERDAHSWVEVYFPEYGWATFDPTPSSDVTSGGWSRIAFYLDAARSMWRGGKINYNLIPPARPPQQRNPLHNHPPNHAAGRASRICTPSRHITPPC